MCMHVLQCIKSHAQIYRPSFHENKPKTLVFNQTKLAFLAFFCENWVYNFGLRRLSQSSIGDRSGDCSRTVAVQIFWLARTNFCNNCLILYTTELQCTLAVSDNILLSVQQFLSQG